MGVKLKPEGPTVYAVAEGKLESEGSKESIVLEQEEKHGWVCESQYCRRNDREEWLELVDAASWCLLSFDIFAGCLYQYDLYVYSLSSFVSACFAILQLLAAHIHAH